MCQKLTDFILFILPRSDHLQDLLQRTNDLIKQLQVLMENTGFVGQSIKTIWFVLISHRVNATYNAFYFNPKIFLQSWSKIIITFSQLFLNKLLGNSRKIFFSFNHCSTENDSENEKH